MEAVGRYSQLNSIEEISDLSAGMDFRLPEYRREVFLRFYEFHSKYRSHPGGVYYLMPYISKKLGFGYEERLWFAYINGHTQNPVMSYIIFKQFPNLQKIDVDELQQWFDSNWSRLQWDTDRRYQKKEFPKSVGWYKDVVAQHGNSTQEYFFYHILDKNSFYHNFDALWVYLRKNFPTMGRLSAFSYSEYLKIMSLPIDCSQLFLEDMDGSRSHRNGLAIVLGRDDLDFKHDKPIYTPAQMEWLKEEAALLLDEAKERNILDASYYTLESALCTYKSWHRPNRRYPNVYSDMLHNRIRWAEERWPEEDLEIFWDARKEYLPVYLRLEDNPNDPGLKPDKQNHYLLTGEVTMMSKDFPEFDNSFDRSILSNA